MTNVILGLLCLTDMKQLVCFMDVREIMLVLKVLAAVERKKCTLLGKPADKTLSAGGNSLFLDNSQHPRI